MKTIFFSFILLLFIALETKAQNCQSPCPYYNDFVKKAEADTVKNTQTKLNYYRAAIVAARDCHCPELEQRAYDQIDTLFILIEEEKRKAEAQAETISKQQEKLKTTLAETEAANDKNLKIVNTMDFYDGKFALALKNEKYGFIDKEGNTKIGFEYDKGGPFDIWTGFAEMEIIDELTNKGVKYLVDTFGHRYQFFNVSEASIFSLKKRLIKSKKEKRIIFEEVLTSDKKSSNEEFSYEFYKSKEKIALNFQDVKKGDVLAVLQYLAEDVDLNYRVEVLLWRGKDLSKFPNVITEFKSMKTIDMYWTDIKKIPKTIDRLSNLRKLKFSSPIKNVPSTFYNLERLESLDLSETKLKSLPETVGNLKKLKELKLPSSLVTLPQRIGDLIHLETLDLYSTNVRVFPNTIGNLKNLKRLELPSKLWEVPPSIYNLEHLECLWLSGVDESVLSEAIGNLKKLKELRIEMPLLDSLPSSIWSLEQLEDFNVWKTRIRELPEGLGNLIRVENLGTPRFLEKVPESIGNLVNLQFLDLSEGDITKIPESIGKMRNLKKLYLPSSAEHFPEGIGTLKKLEILYFPTSVEIFPESIAKLLHIKELNIRNSRNFKEIPDISKFEKLEDFYLKLYKDENYAANIERLKALREKLPNCFFHIRNEKEEQMEMFFPN